MTSAPALSRWYALRPHAEQRALWSSPARFKVAACGRRSGKTELSKRFAVISAIARHDVPDYRVILGSPTWQQTKRVFWKDVVALCPTWALKGQDRRRAPARAADAVGRSSLPSASSAGPVGASAGEPSPPGPEPLPLPLTDVGSVMIGPAEITAADVKDKAAARALTLGCLVLGSRCRLTTRAGAADAGARRG